MKIKHAVVWRWCDGWEKQRVVVVVVACGWVGVGELGVVDYTLERNTSKEVLSLAPLVGFSSGSCSGGKEV